MISNKRTEKKIQTPRLTINYTVHFKPNECLTIISNKRILKKMETTKKTTITKILNSVMQKKGRKHHTPLWLQF